MKSPRSRVQKLSEKQVRSLLASEKSPVTLDLAQRYSVDAKVYELDDGRVLAHFEEEGVGWLTTADYLNEAFARWPRAGRVSNIFDGLFVGGCHASNELFALASGELGIDLNGIESTVQNLSVLDRLTRRLSPKVVRESAPIRRAFVAFACKVFVAHVGGRIDYVADQNGVIEPVVVGRNGKQYRPGLVLLTAR